MDYDYQFKMIIIGDSAVGKSSLLFRFCDDIFMRTYQSTTGVDFKIASLIIPYPSIERPSNVKIQIWDTAGQEIFRSVLSSYYRGVNACMLVFDTTNRESYENIKYWRQQFDSGVDQDAAKLLVGTKIDLPLERKVSNQEGQQLATEMNLQYIETSSLKGENVHQAFMELAYLAVKHVSQQQIRKVNPNVVDPMKKARQKKGCC